MQAGSGRVVHIVNSLARNVRSLVLASASLAFFTFLASSGLAVPRTAPTPVPVVPQETLSPDQLSAGMKGWGVSDFGDGKGIQRFQVEILGVLKRYAPRQDLILGRVSGAGLESSGII